MDTIREPRNKPTQISQQIFDKVQKQFIDGRIVSLLNEAEALEYSYAKY